MSRSVQTNFTAGGVSSSEPKPKPKPEPKPEPKAPAAQSSSEVPDGTVDEIVNWVDGNPDRAQRALDAENAKGRPRSTLISELEDILEEEEEDEGN